MSPCESANTTSLVPNAWIECGLPSRKSCTGPRQCQPRAYRSGSTPVSISRIPLGVSVSPWPPSLVLLTRTRYSFSTRGAMQLSYLRYIYDVRRSYAFEGRQPVCAAFITPTRAIAHSATCASEPRHVGRWHRPRQMCGERQPRGRFRRNPRSSSRSANTEQIEAHGLAGRRWRCLAVCPTAYAAPTAGLPGLHRLRRGDRHPSGADITAGRPRWCVSPCPMACVCGINAFGGVGNSVRCYGSVPGLQALPRHRRLAMSSRPVTSVWLNYIGCARVAASKINGDCPTDLVGKRAAERRTEGGRGHHQLRRRC